MKLKGKVAAITGAAQGIGRACAERFAAEGAKVVIADNQADRLAETAAAMTAEGFEVEAVVGDVSQRADVIRVVEAAVKRFGRLDVMVNNAGVARNQDFLSITDEDFDAVIGVNLRGAFFGVQEAGRQMISQGEGGVIINMSSINALMANPAVATYAISKGGMNQVTTTAAVAFAHHGIRVVGLGPGTILTDMVKGSFMSSAAAEKMILSRTPIGRCGEPEEMASVAAFLASDDASYITGQTIYADGGRMILNYLMPEKA
jgi:glucose 1-dehydrogenase